MTELFSLSHPFFSLSLSLSLRLRHCQSPKNIFYELSYHFSHFSLVRNRFQKHTGQKIPLLFSNLTDTWKKWFLKGYHVSISQHSYDNFVEKKFVLCQPINWDDASIKTLKNCAKWYEKLAAYIFGGLSLYSQVAFFGALAVALQNVHVWFSSTLSNVAFDGKETPTCPFPFYRHAA